MSSREELERKSRRVTNGCLLPIVIILFILWIGLTLTEDQEDFLKYNKKYQYIETESVSIVRFSSSYTPWRGYSMISRDSNGTIGDGRVVRAVGDYIGRIIKVRQLPNGRYIRDKFVLPQKVWDRFLLYFVVYFSIEIIARRRRDKKEE